MRISSSPDVRAALMMCSAALSFTLNDTFTKVLIADYSVTLIIFVRSILAMPMLVGLAIILGRERIRWSPSVLIHAIRGAINFLAAYLYIRGLAFLTVAEATVILFASPCIVTAGSVLLFKERVSVTKWAAVVASFLGVIIAIQPGTGTFQPASLLILAAAILYSANSLTARWIPPQDSLWTVSFFGAAFSALFVGPLTIGHWVPLNLWDLLLFAGAALCSSFGIGLGALAYRSSPASDLAPFSYSGLIWSVSVTWIVWGSLPSLWTFLGASVIIASSVIHFLSGRRTEAAVKG